MNTMPAQKQDRQPGIEAEMQPQPDYTPKFKGAERLKGKVMLVTGGDSGMRRAVAIGAAREGASVAIAYLDEHEDAEETVRLVRQEGTDALAISGDVGSEEFCRKAVA